MDAGYGLAIRWPLDKAGPQAADELREYVVGTSIARFMFLEGLAVKLWRMVEGRWFEGTYVFDSAVSRDAFEAEFRVGADEAPVSRIVGCGPDLIERYEVVAVVEGPAKFRRGPGPGHGSDQPVPTTTRS